MVHDRSQRGPRQSLQFTDQRKGKLGTLWAGKGALLAKPKPSLKDVTLGSECSWRCSLDLLCIATLEYAVTKRGVGTVSFL